MRDSGNSPPCADSSEYAAGCDPYRIFLPTYTSAPSQATLNASKIDLNQLESESNMVQAYDAAGFNQNIITSYRPWGRQLTPDLPASLTSGLVTECSWWLLCV